jgi:hypothetical protein
MSVKRIRATGGLSTDPTAFEQPEALRDAYDVMLNRPGLIGPRFGLGDTTGIATRTTDRRPIKIVPFDGDLVMQSVEGSTYSLERGSVATVISTAVAPPETTLSGVSSFAQARGSLYLTTSTGVKKLVDIADTAITAAGVRQDFVEIQPDYKSELLSESDEFERYGIVDDGAAAYRYCWVREDANGYIRRSSPSARWIVAAQAATGGPWAIEFSRLYLPTGTAAGDRIELYRTENVTPRTATPSTEYYLAIEHVVTSTEVSAGYIAEQTLYDDVPDALLGASLYTNPSQGGIALANEPPPLANCLAFWGDVMWYGNTTSRRTLEIEVVSVADQNLANDPDGKHQRTGFNIQLLTATFTIGSAAVSAIASASGLSTLHGMKVGQYISDATNGPSVAGTKIPALTKINAISTAITIDNATLAPGDTIRIFGHTWTWTAGAPSANQVQIGGTSILSAGNLATKLDGWDFDEPVDVAAANGGTAVVTATEAGGLIVYPAVTGTGQTMAYSLTMSANALASGAAIQFVACDWITINGVEFFGDFTGTRIYHTYASINHPQYRQFLVDASSTGVSPQDFTARISNTATGLAQAVNAYQVVQDPTWGVIAYRDVANTRGESVGDGAMVLMRVTPDLAAFSFSCTVRPLAFRPRASSALTTADTRARGRLYWSKPQEPEAVPVLQFTDVGDKNKDILALVPLERVLLVFKEDGVYSVSGSAPSSWLVQDVDRSLRLVAPQAVCVLGGVCYAWTNRGMMAVTESGAQMLSGPINNRLAPLQRLLALDDTNTKRAFWMVAHERLGLVILGTGTTANATATTYWWVYHTTTQRWAQWQIAAYSAAYDPAEDRMCAGTLGSSPGSSWGVVYERADAATGTTEGTGAGYYDASLSALAGTVSGAVVTIATSAFTTTHYAPAAGDVIADATVARVISSVATNGANYLITVDSSGLSGVSFTWYEAIPSAVVWQAQQLPGIGCRWTEAHLHFHLVDNQFATPAATTPTMQVGAYTDVSTTGPSVSPVMREVGRSAFSPSSIVRVGLPRDVVRAAHLFPRIYVNTAGVNWLLGAIDIHAQQQKQRVTK